MPGFVRLRATCSQPGNGIASVTGGAPNSARLRRQVRARWLCVGRCGDEIPDRGCGGWQSVCMFPGFYRRLLAFLELAEDGAAVDAQAFGDFVHGTEPVEGAAQDAAFELLHDFLQGPPVDIHIRQRPFAVAIPGGALQAKGRSSVPMMSLRLVTTKPWIRFSSSRTLPGQA